MAHKPTAQQSKIEPPEGWKLHSEHGFMRCGDGPADRLVRVADIVLWLMDTKDLPCSAAVDLVCTELQQDALKNGSGLFLLGATNMAKCLPSDYCFLQNQSFWDAQATPGDRGLPGALKWMVALWGDQAAPGVGNVFGVYVLDPLAVRFELAHALWGWGDVAQVVQLHAAFAEAVEPKTYSELVAFRLGNPESEWTTSQRTIAANEAARRKKQLGAKGVAVNMANEFRVSVSRFNGLIRNPVIPGKRETGRAKSA